ncbi:MAG: FAD-dependent monooxygenase [Lewinellaceae bacterium]|nr:FAD-dependent monooxygenase [Lewinellaceae bacterium]
MKITIIGAGIGGLATAIALRKFRPDIELEIFEGSPELKAVGAGLGLAANAVAALDQIGIKEQVLSVSNVLDSFRILDAKGRLISQTNNMAINRNLQVISNFSVHRADLQRVLLAQIPDVPVHLNKRVWDFNQEGDTVHIRFADGAKTETDFVIAADGIHSIFREKLLPESTIRFAGYTCWRGVADLSNFKKLTNLNPKIASESWGLGQRFGIVPLTDGRIYWFACINAPKAKDVRFAAFGQKELAEAFGGFHAPVGELIQMTAPEKILWNDILDFAPVQQFAFGRVLLLGDAAHATTPNMGQGACQAIEDAAILGKILAKNLGPQAAFQAFEEKRLKRTAFIVKRSWQLGKLAQVGNPLLAGLRNFLLRQVPERMNEQQVKALLNVEF